MNKTVLVIGGTGGPRVPRWRGSSAAMGTRSEGPIASRLSDNLSALCPSPADEPEATVSQCYAQS
jgi:hypothetical protein